MSDIRRIWKETELPWNASVRDVKRAYAALIKRYRPDTHPKEFSDARLGYEAALRAAERLERQQRDEASNAPTDTAADQHVVRQGEPHAAQDSSTSFRITPVPNDVPESAAHLRTSKPLSIEDPQDPDPQIKMHRTEFSPPIRQHAAARGYRIGEPGAAQVWLDQLAAARLASPQTVIDAFSKVMLEARTARIDDFLEFEVRLIAFLEEQATPSWILLACADEVFSWRSSARARISPQLASLCELAHRLLPVMLNQNPWVNGLFTASGERSLLISAHSYRLVQRALKTDTKSVPPVAAAALAAQMGRSATMQRLHSWVFYSTDLVAALPTLLLGWIYAKPIGFRWSSAAFAAADCTALLTTTIATIGIRAAWHSARIKACRTWLRRLGQKNPALQPAFLVVGTLLLAALSGTVGLAFQKDHLLIGNVLIVLACAMCIPAASIAAIGVYILWWHLCSAAEALLCEPLLVRNEVHTRIAINRRLALLSDQRARAAVEFRAAQKELDAEHFHEVAQAGTLAAARPRSAKTGSGGARVAWVAFVVVCGLGRLIANMGPPEHPTAHETHNSQSATPQLQLQLSTGTKADGAQQLPSATETASRRAPPPISELARLPVYNFSIKESFCGREQKAQAKMSEESLRERKFTGFASIGVGLDRAGSLDMHSVMTSNAFLIDGASSLIAGLSCPPSTPRYAPLNLNFSQTPVTTNPMIGGHDNWMLVEELHASKADPTVLSQVHQAAAWMQADLAATGISVWDLANFQKSELSMIALGPWMKIRGAQHVVILHLVDAHAGLPASIRVDVAPALPRSRRTAGGEPDCNFPQLWSLEQPDSGGPLPAIISKTASCIGSIAVPTA